MYNVFTLNVIIRNYKYFGIDLFSTLVQQKNLCRLCFSTELNSNTVSQKWKDEITQDESLLKIFESAFFRVVVLYGDLKQFNN